jgi:organic radical activating enzyme
VLPNPVDVSEITACIASALNALPHSAVSFTGGEPLLHHWLITAAAPTVRGCGSRVLLETDGTMPERMRSVREAVDIVSMDWKLPSATGLGPLDAQHEAFLFEARGLERSVKLVLTRECTLDDVRHVATRVAATAADATLILQPVTPLRGIQPPASADLLRFQEMALRFHPHVRVLPQLHRALALP